MATLNINLDNVQPLNTLLTGISQLGYSGNAGLFLKINATEDGFEFSAGGSSGVSIGDTIGGGTAGSVLFLGAAGVLAQDNANNFWDSTNKRQGYGTNIPLTTLHVKGGIEGALGAPSERVMILEGSLPELMLKDTFAGANSFSIVKYGSLLYFARVNSSGVYLGYAGTISQGSEPNWNFGNGSPGQAKVHARATSASNITIIAQGATSQSGNLYENRLVAGTVISGWDANGNLFSNTGSGIQLATAASQKIGFWGATPIVQPTTAITAATYASVSGSFVKASDTFDGYSIGQVVKALRNEGLLA